MEAKKLLRQRGDTIVEVLLSIAILSLVIVGGSTLINVGMQNAINSVEHTQVRNLVVGQAELLRYLRDNADQENENSISEVWYDTLLDADNDFVNTASPTPIDTCSPVGGRQPFYLTVTYNGDDQKPDIAVREYQNNVSDSRPYAVPGRGLWVEGVASPAGTSPVYIDFHIRACWQGTGTSDYEQQSNTVIRLYRQ